MHELSIAEALVDAVRNELWPYPGAQVHSVNVQVGALRQVQAETLTVCFQAATRGTRLEGSRLRIEPVAARARCRECAEEFAMDDAWFMCPRCRTADAQLLAGNELQLTGIELAEAAK